MIPKIKPSLALAILGLTLSGVGSASATTFTDSFDSGIISKYDINAGQATSRQTGVIGGVSYNEPARSAAGGDYDYLTQLGNNGAPTGSGTASLILAAYSGVFTDNLAYVSPNINLAPTALGTATVSFGVDPLGSGSSAYAGNWAAGVIGASGQGNFVNASNGMGFRLQHNGGFQAFDGGTQIAGGNYVLAAANPLGGDAYQIVSATLTNTSGGGVFSISVNGTPITFFNTTSTYTRALGFTDNFVTLEAVTAAGVSNNSYFNNLVITNDSAAPEPSQMAGLGFAGFGLLGLLLKARRSRVTAK